jgi:hypothetical protein
MVVGEATGSKRYSLDCPFILIQRLSCNKFLIGNLIAADGLLEVVVEEATAPKR